MNESREIVLFLCDNTKFYNLNHILLIILLDKCWTGINLVLKCTKSSKSDENKMLYKTQRVYELEKNIVSFTHLKWFYS